MLANYFTFCWNFRNFHLKLVQLFWQGVPSSMINNSSRFEVWLTCFVLFYFQLSTQNCFIRGSTIRYISMSRNDINLRAVQVSFNQSNNIMSNEPLFFMFFHLILRKKLYLPKCCWIDTSELNINPLFQLFWLKNSIFACSCRNARVGTKLLC